MSELNQPWLLWLDAARDPYLNMAIDEVLLRHHAERPLLRFYDWSQPAVTIGYFQPRTDAAPDAFCVRRITGGGLVEHGDDITYALVLPRAHALAGVDRNQSYRAVHQAIISALATVGVAGSLSEDVSYPDKSPGACFVRPVADDVMFAGEKVAGAAQRRSRDGLLMQGSINFGRTALSVPRERVVGELCRVFATLLGTHCERFTPGSELLRQAAELCDVRYRTDEWNGRR